MRYSKRKNTALITFRFPVKLIECIKIEAEDLGMSLNSWVINVLRSEITKSVGCKICPLLDNNKTIKDEEVRLE